ncbi:MAG: DUF1552 domain-containing protein [Planctomycetales bacterium]
MNQPTPSQLDRRRFLRGVGVSLALPALESLPSNPLLAAENKAGANDAWAKRFVCLAPDYGVHPGGFFPQQPGRDYDVPNSLKSLENLRKDFSVFSNTDHPGVGGGHACTRTLLNGVKSGDAAGDRRKLTSLDQIISEHIGTYTRFPSLVTGRGAPISYTHAGIPIPSISDPDRFFNLLFVEDDQKEKTRRRASLSDNASILDVLLEDSRSLKTRLAAHDGKKLDEYLTAVRETERKLARRRNWIDVAKPKVKPPKADEDAEETDYPYDMALFHQLMALALQTDSTRVLTYQMPGGNRRFTFEGVTMGYHTLTHHGKDPERVGQLQIIDSYYLEQLAGFIRLLQKTDDAQGQPLLDSTIVFFGSGMGNASSHSSRNLPALVAGGGFKHGYHHALPKNGDKNTPLSNLYVTFLQQLGIETDRFATNNGDLNHLLI